ncbi:Cupredoxin [Mycena metata]|uniref:laccase n=1 Tax=Mycena metata TaxID=1033252 RepID=A0AAD7GWW5_9AGAR|nr:Cupredoxin [Mycena metata]
MQFLLAIPALLAALKANAAIRDYTLDIVNGPVDPDGFTRIGVLANGTFPGPPMLVTKGDTLQIKVNNKLHAYVDLHRSFGNQTGSYWYHSQLSVQYADGLRGVIVVYDPEDPLAHLYDVDDESTIWTTADWWHNTSTSGLAGYLRVADSGLFNARGRCNGSPLTPYAVQTVKKGTRYRFRISLSQTDASTRSATIQNHNATDTINTVNPIRRDGSGPSVDGSVPVA